MDSNTLIDRTRHCRHFLFHRIVVKVNTLITWLHLISSCTLFIEALSDRAAFHSPMVTGVPLHCYANIVICSNRNVCKLYTVLLRRSAAARRMTCQRVASEPRDVRCRPTATVCAVWKPYGP